MLENTESQEMYLTTIYALQKKNGMVRSVDVADERGYSKVSVHTKRRTALRLWQAPLQASSFQKRR